MGELAKRRFGSYTENARSDIRPVAVPALREFGRVKSSFKVFLTHILLAEHEVVPEIMRDHLVLGTSWNLNAEVLLSEGLRYFMIPTRLCR